MLSLCNLDGQETRSPTLPGKGEQYLLFKRGSWAPYRILVGLLNKTL